MRIVLPWPPTANTSKMRRKKGSRGKGFFSTDDLRVFHEKAKWMIYSAGLTGRTIEPPYRLTIYYCEKLFRGGDLPNFEKAPVDALKKAGIIMNPEDTSNV